MGVSRAARLNVICTDGNLNRFAIARRCASPDHRVKTISPQAIVFLPLPLDESQIPALADDSLAGRVSLGRGMIVDAVGVLTWHTAAEVLCRNICSTRHQCKKHTRYQDPARSAHRLPPLGALASTSPHRSFSWILLREFVAVNAVLKEAARVWLDLLTSPSTLNLSE
jgi:hypothetical protein